MKHVLGALLAFALAASAVVATQRGEAPEPMIAAEATPEITVELLSASEVRDGVDAPIWRTGYAWDVRFSEAYADLYPEGYACGLAVVDDTGEGYLQGFVCNSAVNTAVELATNPLPFLGNLSYALNGARDGEEIAFFSWPLADGAQWPMRFDGNDYEVTARFDMVDGPFGEEPGYVMEAEFDEGSDTIIEWTYVPSIAWWGSIEFVNEGHFVEVVGFTPTFEGTAFTADVREALTSTTNNGPLGPSNQFSAVDEDELIHLVGRFEGSYAYDVQLQTPTGRTTYQARDLAGTGDGSLSYIITSEPGTWTLQTLGVAFPGSAELVVYAGRGVAWVV